MRPDDVRYNDSQFVQRLASCLLSNCLRISMSHAFHGATAARKKRARTPISIEMANDNFSVSSHLIYDVPVMEETCDDWRISTRSNDRGTGREERKYGTRGLLTERREPFSRTDCANFSLGRTFFRTFLSFRG